MLKFEPRECKTEYNEEQVKTIQQSTGLSKAVVRILCNRGINTADDAKRYLHPGPDHIHDPFLLPDMQESVERIQRAVSNKERITIFCDYDADGTCGGCALYLHLQSMGAYVDIMTPNRHKEGYGLNMAAVDRIAEAGTRLIITVDCGISNIAETAYAKEQQIDVIITDHHECGDVLPDTPYIINPKRKDSQYPCSYIAGCGVAFKLIHALSSLAHAMQYIDLIAIGTITDIVPLLDENRAIAHLGIQKLRNKPSAGVTALAEAAGIRLASISSFGVSFGLGPRINAAGRMDTAHAAINILKASRLGRELTREARDLCALNDLRKKEVADILESAEQMIDENEYMKDNAILLADERWNSGVIGIAAAKIAEKYVRPCVLFGGNDGELVGSARSIEGINMFETLGAFQDRYEKFGGHAQAAGLTIKPSVLEGLRRDVCTYIGQHYDESVFVQKKVYDLALEPAEISAKLIRDIERLEPFGCCNEKPFIAVFDGNITQPKFVGKDEKPHLKFLMCKQGKGIDAVRFFFKDDHAFTSRTCDFLCEASINDYTMKPQLVVRQMAMHYDKRLVDTFVTAHQMTMVQRFVDEIICLGRGNGMGLSEEVFAKIIESQFSKSRFGLCIKVNTLPALRRLLEISVVDTALKKDALIFYDSKSFAADNCIACGCCGGHDRLYSVGVTGKEAFFDKKLMTQYKQHAASYYSEREPLLEIYQRMVRVTSKTQRTAEELSRLLVLPLEKVAFALQVFTELELIEQNKSGRIHALKRTGPKKELKQSECYRSFQRILGVR